MSSFKDIVEGLVKEYGKDWSDEDRALAARVASDYAVLHGRALAGETVPETEWRHVNAQVKALAAAASFSGRNVFLDAFTKWTSVATNAVVSGLFGVVPLPRS